VDALECWKRTVHVAYPPPPRTVCCCRRRYPLTAADNATTSLKKRRDPNIQSRPTTEQVQIRPSPLEVTPALAGSPFSGSPTHPSAAPEAPGADERLPNLAAAGRVGVGP